jgi:hypothetical protein
MSKFELNSDDVVFMDPNQSVIGLKTFRVGQFMQTLKERMGGSTLLSWLEEGAECELLSASLGGGWKKGKVRIRFEFVEDEPKQAENPDSPVISSDVEQMDQ